MRMMGLLPASSTVLGSDPLLIPLPGRGGRRVRCHIDPGTTHGRGGRNTGRSRPGTTSIARRCGGQRCRPSPRRSSNRTRPRDAVSSAVGPAENSSPSPTRRANSGSETGLLGLVPLVQIEDVPADSRNARHLPAGGCGAPHRRSLGPSDERIPSCDPEPAGTGSATRGSTRWTERRSRGQGRRQRASGRAAGPRPRRPRTANPIDAVDGRVDPGLSPSPPARHDHRSDRRRTRVGLVRPACRAAFRDDRGGRERRRVHHGTRLPAPEGCRPGDRNDPLDPEQTAALGWKSPMPANWFEPLQTTLSANGNPIEAASMGFRQTWRMVVLTYLTIDRLIRGSVSVEQSPRPGRHRPHRYQGRSGDDVPAVLPGDDQREPRRVELPAAAHRRRRALPLPGLREDPRTPRRSPFQNAAALAGLALIGTLFIVTFFNDVKQALRCRLNRTRDRSRFDRGGGGIGRATAMPSPSTAIAWPLLGRSPGSSRRRRRPSNTETLQLEVDLTDDAACVDAIDAIGARFGRLDVIVNNAGLRSGADRSRPTPSCPETVDANLVPIVLVSQAWPMLVACRGCVVNVSSMASIDPFQDSPHTRRARRGSTRSPVRSWRRPATPVSGPSPSIPGIVETPLLRTASSTRP